VSKSDPRPSKIHSTIQSRESEMKMVTTLIVEQRATMTFSKIEGMGGCVSGWKFSYSELLAGAAQVGDILLMLADTITKKLLEHLALTDFGTFYSPAVT
jgi:hypothetical protein